MRPLQNSAGSISNSETPGETGGFTVPLTGKEYYHDLISRANSVCFIKIFKHYGLRLDAHNIKIICPFLSHKGGRENSASFMFYPQTNSFYCHGCGVGGAPCNFVEGMERCSKVKAAIKILESFDADAAEDHVYDYQSS